MPRTPRPFWFPLAVFLTLGNLAGVWFAARPGEPWHATLHAALAVVCALWAAWLRSRLRGRPLA